MANNLDDMKARLAELSDERAQLGTAIDEMIAAMAELPLEQRSASDWGPDGASTRKYLELTKRQATVEAEMIDLGRAIVESDEPVSSLHAKIGELTLENDFLEGALGKAGLLSAKR